MEEDVHRRPEADAFLDLPLLYFLRRGQSLNLKLTDVLDCLATKSHGSTRLPQC